MILILNRMCLEVKVSFKPFPLAEQFKYCPLSLDGQRCWIDKLPSQIVSDITMLCSPCWPCLFLYELGIHIELTVGFSFSVFT